jgi:glycosyltransferase involved in cell wall biosynthesis
VKRAAFAVPGSLDTPTGGYAYDKRIIDELRALGWQIDVVDLGSSFPHPDAAARAAALAKLLALPEGQPVVIDGLAFGAMAEEAQRLRALNPLVALVHHPLALETGVDAVTSRALRDSERAALACARNVIVTSAPTAAIVAGDYAVPADRIVAIRPGVDVPARKPRAQGDRSIVELLAVGSVTPRKGYDILIEVLASLKALPWRLTIAGDTTRSATAWVRLQSDVAMAQLLDRITLTGAVTEARLTELYISADVFVLASLFEGYGMVFGEAIAHGLPVVATSVGAAQEIVPPDAGILVPPGDATALREALRRVIENADARGRMAAAALEAAKRLPDWRQSAKQFAQVLEDLS